MDLQRVKIIREMVDAVARRSLPSVIFADLRVTAPAQVIDAPNHLGVMIEGAKRFGDDDYIIRAMFSLDPAEQADNDAVIKKTFLASEAIKGNVFIELRGSAIERRHRSDGANDIVFGERQGQS